jgi:ribonuclease G
VQNEILINATPGETRVAILEKSQFVELHLERTKSRNVAGSIVKGRVTRVLPGMQAAFVDVGLEKAAFLYAGDYVENIESIEEDEEPRGRRNRGRNGGGRRVPSIETLLREGQEIVVQIAKEPIGSKGARITSHVSIAGRHLVLTPWAQRVGVSRRIDSDRERRRLREIVNRIRPPDLGFIIRTAGEGTREADLEADVRYLTAVWDDVQIHKDRVRAPEALYREPSLPLRVIRDFANFETKRIVIDSKQAYEEMKSFVDRFIADPKPHIKLYEGIEPIFDHFGTESQIDANLGRKVWLKSGGYLIIDQSEALTAIDVNTGRYVGRRDLEDTVLKTNLEAVREVVQQLRFRNIGGLIIIDLIDMESSENREKTFRALQDAIRQDKARTNILKISELGLVEMTRKRTRENLVQMLCEPCAYCNGKGYVLSEDSMAQKVLREIKKDLPRFCGRRIAVSVNRRVAERLLGLEKETLEGLERELGREIEIRARSEMHQEQFEITALDDGAAVALDLPWLSSKAEDQEQPPAANEPDEAQATPAEEKPIGPPESDAEPASPEDPSVAADSGEASMAEVGVTEEEAPGDLEPAGIPPAEENPALTAPSPSLDDPVKSPIMQRSHEREES